jgi:hypothetical protein
LKAPASASDGGVSQQSRLNDINPDIATILKCKGASAGSFYMARKF